jgi:hypothetical protein
MRKARTTCHWLFALALLAGGGAHGFAGGNADKKSLPAPLPPQVEKAWRDAGAEVGWMKDLPPELGTFQFWEPWRDKRETAAIPAFRFPRRDAAGRLAKLPDPGSAFGLDFHCGFYAGVTLKEMANLPNLQSLCIGGGCQGEAYDDLTDLAALTNLRGLYLFYLSIPSESLKPVARLKNLQVLDLSHTKVTDDGVKELAGLGNLRALNLCGTATSDEGIAHLAGLRKLQSLNLSRTRVADAGMKTVAGLEGLQELDLTYTAVADAGLKHLAGCESLESLVLERTAVTDAGLEHLAASKRLRSLNLSRTQVTDNGLTRLAGLKKLQELQVNYTAVTDAGVAELRKALPSVRVYNLRN